MTDKPMPTCAIDLPAAHLGMFMPLWGAGVSLPVETGHNLRQVLCDQLGLTAEYLDQRIQTIFHNGHPIDDVETSTVCPDDSIALSAAMPGLVGATLRKGGHLAAMRGNISATAGKPVAAADGKGWIRLKLFNLVARELGPGLLSRGVGVSGPLLSDIGRQFSADQMNQWTIVRVDDHPVDTSAVWDLAARCELIWLVLAVLSQPAV